jgi:hypothetical protein
MAAQDLHAVLFGWDNYGIDSIFLIQMAVKKDVAVRLGVIYDYISPGKQ